MIFSQIIFLFLQKWSLGSNSLDVLPQLADYKIITEFGRSIFTKRGISVSKIETVKDWGEKIVAMAHFGSNQFIREGM